MRVYTAPEIIDWEIDEKASVFLAGSIEMDQAEEWQGRVISALSHLRVAVFNPRRTTWDDSWKQEMSNPNFNEQVNWELDHLNKASVKFFYFDPETKSPITLMELGYVLGQNEHEFSPVIVVCPKGFWRRGNIEIMCHRAGVHLYEHLTDGLTMLENTLGHRLKLANAPAAS